MDKEPMSSKNLALQQATNTSPEADHLIGELGSRYNREFLNDSSDPVIVAQKHLDKINLTSTLATIRSIKSIIGSTSRLEFLSYTINIYKSLPEWPIDQLGKKVGEKKAISVAAGRAYVAIRAMLHDRFNADMTEKSPEQIKNDRKEKLMRNIIIKEL